MLGKPDALPSESRGAFLNPIQVLRSQPLPAQFPPTPSFPVHRDLPLEKAPVREEPAAYHGGAVPATPAGFHPQYAVLIANLISALRKISRNLIASNELIDGFATEKGGTAIELRSLLAPPFTEMELLLATTQKDVLNAQKMLAQSTSSAPLSTRSTPAASMLHSGRQSAYETMSLPPDPPIMTPIFPPRQLERLDHNFAFLTEQLKESSANATARPQSLPLASTPSMAFSEHPMTHTPHSDSSQPKPSLFNPSGFFDIPAFQPFQNLSAPLEEPTSEAHHHETQGTLSALPNQSTGDSHHSGFHFGNSSSDIFKKLNFGSGTHLPSVIVPPTHDTQQMAHEKPQAAAAAIEYTNASHFHHHSTSTYTSAKVEESADEIEHLHDSFQTLGLTSTGKEGSNRSDTPHTMPSHASAHKETPSSNYLELLMKDLRVLLVTEQEMSTIQSEFWTKEQKESMRYHALAISRQKWDQSSNQKFDHRTLHQDMKGYSKRHGAALEHGLSQLAFAICVHLKEAELLDKSVISVCNTIMLIDGLPVRIFTMLHMLIHELRELLGMNEHLAEFPMYLREEIQKPSGNPANLAIFFGALAINSGLDAPKKCAPFYLNPVFGTVETLLSRMPPRNSNAFELILIVLDMGSYYLSARDATRLDAILETLQSQYGVDEDDFGFNDPEKVWPFFVIKDDWDVEKLVGFHVQYGSDSSIRKLHQEAISFKMDSSVKVEKQMGFKLKPLLANILPEHKWVKKACRVMKQAFAMFQKDNERAFLATIISIWIMRGESTNGIEIGKLSQSQMNNLCQVLMHLFPIYRVFKIALFHALLTTCPILVVGEFTTRELSPETVVAYGRFWATLAITIPWLGEPNSYFVTPIFMLLENIPSHPRSELLVCTILDVSEHVLRKFKPGNFNTLLPQLCAKYPMVRAKYAGIPGVPAHVPEPAAAAVAAPAAPGSVFDALHNEVRELTFEKADSLAARVLEAWAAAPSPAALRESMEVVISIILDVTEVSPLPGSDKFMVMGNFAFILIEKHKTFYASFTCKLFERCPLLNTRVALPYIGDPQKLEKCLKLLSLNVILHNRALLRGATMINALDLLAWYEHVVRSGATPQTADILAYTVQLSHNFLTNERFIGFLKYVLMSVMPTLPETPSKPVLLRILNSVFSNEKTG